MTKRLAAKYKINRRYGVNLWGRSKSPINRREYKPGQHGQKSLTGGTKISNFGLQLTAKQKLRGYYGGIVEKQFRKIYSEADRLRGNTGENFLNFLERRLDAVVYRMKFTPTIFSARQFVNHGHVKVNGRRVNIPSYRVSDGDQIEVKESSRQIPLILEAIKSSERDVPDYIQVDHKVLKGTFLRTPTSSDIPYPIQMNTNLVVEWYSRRA